MEANASPVHMKGFCSDFLKLLTASGETLTQGRGSGFIPHSPFLKGLKDCAGVSVMENWKMFNFVLFFCFFPSIP